MNPKRELIAWGKTLLWLALFIAVSFAGLVLLISSFDYPKTLFAVIAVAVLVATRYLIFDE